MTRLNTVQVIEANGLTAERPMETGAIWSPRVIRIEDDRIVYDATAYQKLAPVRQSMIASFADLANSTDDAIVRFAERWGALGIADDGWPPASYGQSKEESESLAGWRRLASRFRALINLGAALNSGKPGAKEDWIVVGDRPSGRYDLAPPWLLKAPDKTSRTEIMIFVREMVQRFKVSPRFWWNSKRKQWQIDLDAYGRSNLPGLLAIQLMITIADKEGFGICSNCHRSYVPEKRPSPGRRNYCQRPECRILAANRDAARDKRERERSDRSKGKANGKTKTRKR